MSVCICSLSIAPCFRNCKRRRGNFLHFGRSTKNTRRFWAKWRKIRASLRPWPPLGGGCRRSRLGERNYVLRLSLRRPAGDTSLTEGGKREGQSPSPTGGFTEVPPEIVSPSVALQATPPSQREARKKSRRGRFFFCFFHHSHHFSGRVTVTVVPWPSRLVRDTVPWW